MSRDALNDPVINELGAAYLARLSKHADGAERVVDTTPMNFRLVGLIATILPCARMIHCVRDPMDTCVSIFQQPLASTHAYADDLADLGGFYRIYSDLMDYWRSVLPGRVYDLQYEDLVNDSEAQIRGLLDYCGMPFHEDCLAFHRTERAVKTPSAGQVRQPIYQGSVGRWKRYESRLGPLRAAMGIR